MRVVLLPGLDGTGELFRELIECAPSDVGTEVIAYPPDRVLGYAECVDHVEQRLVGREPYVVVAESFSGPVAVLLAARSDPRLRGLVLCNTFVCSPAWSGFRHLPWPRLFQRPVPKVNAGLFLVGLDQVGLWADPIAAANAPVRPDVLAARMRSVLTVDVRDELAKVKVPVLALRGARDRLIGAASARRMLAAKPDMEVATVDGPHLLLQVEPTASWRAVLPFISACLAAQPAEVLRPLDGPSTAP
jgi:pimeloyl-ACP methyl ester carboxylesterase